MGTLIEGFAKGMHEKSESDNRIIWDCGTCKSKGKSKVMQNVTLRWNFNDCSDIFVNLVIMMASEMEAIRSKKKLTNLNMVCILEK